MHHVFLNSDSYLYWYLAYIREGIFDLRIYVAVTSSYLRDRGVTIYKEVVEFYNEYLSNVEAIRLFKRVCTKRIDGNSKIGLDVITVSRDLLYQANRYVLNNTVILHNEHMDYTRCTNLTKSRREKRVIDEHNKSFIKWVWNLFVDQLSTKSICVSKNLRWLAHRPFMDVVSYHGNPSNGYFFFTQKHMMTVYCTK